MQSYHKEIFTFRNLVFAQLIYLFALILGKEFVKYNGLTVLHPAVIIGFTCLALFYNISMYLMATYCSPSPLIKNILKISIFFGIILYAIVENPFFEIPGLRSPGILAVHILLFFIEVTVLVVAIKDLLQPNKYLQTKLWASVALYLTLVITWGSIYEMLSVLFPGCMGSSYQLGVENYVECVSYSFGIVTSGDEILKPIPLILQISKIQALMFSFFFIFLLSQIKEKVKKIDDN